MLLVYCVFRAYKRKSTSQTIITQSHFPRVIPTSTCVQPVLKPINERQEEYVISRDHSSSSPICPYGSNENFSRNTNSRSTLHDSNQSDNLEITLDTTKYGRDMEEYQRSRSSIKISSPAHRKDGFHRQRPKD